MPTPEVPSPLFPRLLFALLPDPSSFTDMLSDLQQRLSLVKCAAREVLRLRRGRCFVDSRRGSSWWLRLRSVLWKGRLLGFEAGLFQFLDLLRICLRDEECGLSSSLSTVALC